MLVNDFDDEHTLDEEEEIVDGSENAEDEIDKLQEVHSSTFSFSACSLTAFFHLLLGGRNAAGGIVSDVRL